MGGWIVGWNERMDEWLKGWLGFPPEVKFSGTHNIERRPPQMASTRKLQALRASPHEE